MRKIQVSRVTGKPVLFRFVKRQIFSFATKEELIEMLRLAEALEEKERNDSKD